MKTYEKLLEQAKKMMWVGMGNLYDRTKLLMKVYDDPEFQADQEAGKQEANQTLSRVLQDCPTNFLEMMHLVRMFPRRTQWTTGSLSDMRLQLFDKVKDNNKKAKKDKLPAVRNAVSLAQYRALEEKCKSLETENQLLKMQNAELIERIKSMAKTIDILEKKMTKRGA